MSTEAPTETPVITATESVAPAQTTTTGNSATVTKPAAVTTESSPSVSTKETDWLGSIDEAISTGISEESEEKVAPKTNEKNVEKVVSESLDEDSEDDAALNTMTKAARAKFKQLKADLKIWKQKATELEKQTPTQKVAEPEDYTQLKSKLDEYEKEISVSRVEASPKYKEIVIQPLNGLLSSAYSLGDRYEVPEETMEAALAESDPAKQNELLQDLAAGFTERDRMNLYRLVDDLDVVLKRRHEILSNAKVAHETLTKQEQERSRQENSQAYESVWKILSTKIPMFSDSSIAEEVRTKAQSSDLVTARPDVRAYAAYSGAMLPHVLKQNQTLTAKVAELEKTISGFRKTVPKPGKGHAAPSEGPSDMGFLEALEAQL